MLKIGITFYNLLLPFFLITKLSGQSIPTLNDSLNNNKHSSEIHLDEVKVTAYQTDSKLKSMPGAITVLQVPFLKKPGEPNLLKAFYAVPGMNIQQGALNTSQISIRGIGTRYAYGTRKIKVFYDQIPLTNGEGDTFIDDISAEETGNIEIIKGPASSVYGSSLGGTILIHPLETWEYGSSLELMYGLGSFNYFKNGARFQFSKLQKSLNLNISQLNSGGFRENSKYNRTSIALNSSGTLYKKTDYNFLFSFAQVFAQIPSSLDSATFTNHPEYAAETWKNTKGNERYKRIHVGMGVTFHQGMKSDWNFIVYASYRKGEETRPFNFLNEVDNTIGTKLIYHSTNNIVDFPVKLSAGFHLFREFYNSFIFENIDRLGSKGAKINHNRQNIGQNDMYIQGELEISDHLRLTTGFNFNISGFHFKDLYSADTIDQSGNYSFKPIASPRLGLNYSLNRRVFFYSTISHGFSLPSLSETLSPLGLINRNIKPEHAWNAEAGMRGHIISQYTFIDVTVYRMWVTDLIVPKRIADDVYVGMNAGRSDHSGLELDINSVIFGKYNFRNIPISKFVLTTNLTYSYNHFKFGNFVQNDQDYSGNYLPGVPMHRFFGDIILESRFGIYINPTFQYLSRIPLNDANSLYSSGYCTVSSTIGYSVKLKERWTCRLNFSAYNITNTKYASMVVINAPGTLSNPPRYYYPGNPLNFLLSIEIKQKFK